jgi:hypothetical protein
MRNHPYGALLCLMCALPLCAQTPLDQAPPDQAQADQAKQSPPATASNPPQTPSQPTATPAQPTTPDQPITPPQPGAKPADANLPIDKRVFGVIPNNRTTSGTVPFKPITARQKLVIALKDSFDWPPYATGALFALWSQARNTNPSFGQGVAGYARRWGTASADQVSGNMMTEGLVPAAFGQDPRYFLIGPGQGYTWKQRAWHAIESIFVAPMDSGKKVFNFSEWGGNAAATAIGNLYYPDQRDVHDNVNRWLTFIGTDTFSNLLKEFWPDVKLKLHHKKPPPGVISGKPATGNKPATTTKQ